MIRRTIMLRQKFLAGLTGVLALGANACVSYNSDYPTQPARVAVVGVRVTPQTVQFTTIGQQLKLTLAVQPANATDQAVTWESTDTSIATVDAAGVVTARKAGAEVFVTATTHDGHFQSSTNVTVAP